MGLDVRAECMVVDFTAVFGCVSSIIAAVRPLTNIHSDEPQSVRQARLNCAPSRREND